MARIVQAGLRYTLFGFGSDCGSFGMIDTSGLPLADSTARSRTAPA